MNCLWNSLSIFSTFLSLSHPLRRVFSSMKSGEEKPFDAVTYLLDLRIFQKKIIYATNPSANMRSNFTCQSLAPANPSLGLPFSEFHRLEMKDWMVLAKDDDSMITPAPQSEFRNSESYVCLLNSVSDTNGHLYIIWVVCHLGVNCKNGPKQKDICWKDIGLHTQLLSTIMAQLSMLLIQLSGF